MPKEGRTGGKKLKSKKRRARDVRLDDNVTYIFIVYMHSVALFAEPPLEIGRFKGTARVAEGAFVIWRVPS